MFYLFCEGHGRSTCSLGQFIHSMTTTTTTTMMIIQPCAECCSPSVWFGSEICCATADWCVCVCVCVCVVWLCGVWVGRACSCFVGCGFARRQLAETQKAYHDETVFGRRIAEVGWSIGWVWLFVCMFGWLVGTWLWAQSVGQSCMRLGRQAVEESGTQTAG